MPEAAAIQPNEWATIHDNFEPFDIAELNRVVLDYAHIELAMANRWHRRSPLGRACAMTGRCLTILGLMAAVALGLFMIAGVDGEALLPVVCAGAGLGGVAVLGWLVPWALTPYRQWDRTLCGVSVMMTVIAAVSLGAVLLRDFAAAPRWMLAAPCLALLLVAVGALVADYRFRSTAKPPAVDVGSLSPGEIEVLLAVRRRALTILRSRNVVSYADFPRFDDAPLDAPPVGGV
ncbi:hypothetical protein LO763_27005 [Glycomyces sp. A-F 0318]|uniref:hypothetical protein n=1 Tax=Glycomyces amatae TaxID=2881355 RepID=UPI001E3EA096|nr:hypothetical protein [Glycomyces amatae]MCD0447269.1 hypothetical protein [Glycomyces amatae]